MKPLDEYIRSNLDRFNSEEPLNGHFERFEDKLGRLERRRISQPRMVILRIAALVILGLVISYAAIREFNLLKQSKDAIYSGTIGSELDEAEKFYTTQLNISYHKIQNLRFNNDKDEKKQVLEELSEMDTQVQAMKQDLKQNPDDERIVHAIINFYQVKMEMMDMIITRTQQSTNSIL
jgi:hypothetical protein